MSKAGVLTPASWGRLAVPDALTGPQIAAADDDDSVAQGDTAAILMHALGMRRGHCTLLTCWTVPPPPPHHWVIVTTSSPPCSMKAGCIDVLAPTLH